jgi:hypothetical protein
MQQRIYVVTEKNSGYERLVMAQTPAQAMRHVTSDKFEVKAASAAVVARLMGHGAKLEQTTTATVED